MSPTRVLKWAQFFEDHDYILLSFRGSNLKVRAKNGIPKNLWKRHW